MSDKEFSRINPNFPGLKLVRASYTGCNCTQILVVEDSRDLQCESCGKIISPFDYLYKYAVKQQKIVWENNHLKNEIKGLSEKVKNLKREERNARARVNNLNKKLKERIK